MQATCARTSSYNMIVVPTDAWPTVLQQANVIVCMGFSWINMAVVQEAQWLFREGVHSKTSCFLEKLRNPFSSYEFLYQQNEAKTAGLSLWTLVDTHSFLHILGDEIHNWKIMLIASPWDSLGGGGAFFLSWSVDQNLLVAAETLYLPYWLHCVVYIVKSKFHSTFSCLLFYYQVPMGTSLLAIIWLLEMILNIDMQMICLLLRVRNLLIEVIVQVSYLYSL